MIKKLLYSISLLMILTVVSSFWFILKGNGSSDDMPQGIDPFAEAVAPAPIIQAIEGVVDAHLAYPFDILAIDEYFIKVRAFPGAGVPGITGGFVTTNVELVVKLRGVSVPSACRTPESRSRPHEQVARERMRWAAGMEYVSSLLMMNKSLRLENLAVVDGKLVADVYYSRGNAWHDLSETLIQDGFAKSDTSTWNWGAEQLQPQ